MQIYAVKFETPSRDYEGVAEILILDDYHATRYSIITGLRG
jgi:hypothetical protein